MDVKTLQEWFVNHVQIDGRPYELDDDQAEIVLDDHKNLLVTARAGSGKTYTLIAKIIYLVAHEDIPPEKILALSYNAKPQEDMRERLSRVLVDGSPILNGDEIALTFHAFARRAIGDAHPICAEERTDYINEIMRKKVTCKEIYNYVRDDSYEPKREDYNNDDDYYQATRYTTYDTLDGRTVRSRGEKIIADFLFEHDIDYAYERSYYPARIAKLSKDAATRERLEEHEEFKPDFYLTQYDIIWEHWGIRGDENASEIKKINNSGAIGKYEEYDKNKQDKEWFYGKEWLKTIDLDSEAAQNNKALQFFLTSKSFIYTNYKRDASREEFEQEIKELLEGNGVECRELSEEEKLAKFQNTEGGAGVWGAMAERIEQFIDRAEQQFPGDYEGLELACRGVDEKNTRLFYGVGLKAYTGYMDELCGDQADGILEKMFPGKIYDTDFNIIMERAAAEIAAGRIHPSKDLDSLEYLFLDEYQDFSLLFLNLVMTMRRRNEKIKTMAVGDDWQAINGWTGASLEYFDNFKDYFEEDAAEKVIRTNRRSVPEIVEAANHFMQNALDDAGTLAKAQRDSTKGALKDLALIDVRNYARDNERQRTGTQRKYELVLSTILNENPGKDFLIIDRTRHIKFEGYNKSLSKWGREFAVQYGKHFKNVRGVTFSTVNKVKGMESDIVVILESDTGRFPVFHPDTHLFKAFGEDEQRALDEQKRLFYVALTRAKDKVYILHKDDIRREEQDETERSDRNFLSLLEMKDFEKYWRREFLTVQEQLERKYISEFKVKAVSFQRNQYDAEKIDIIATALNGDEVRQYREFDGTKSVREMRNLARRCSAQRPGTVRVGWKPWKNGREYMKMYAA